jgi:SAM-dependent methyltransferase
MENAGIAPIHGRHGVRSDQHVVRDSYSARSQEYVDLFGAMTSTHPSDRALVRSWASTLTGPVLDAGCGPGQWTGFLAQCGLTVSGIDLVPEFVELARSRYPELSFDIGRFEESGAATGSLGGVMSWYTLIHHDPPDMGTPLAEFARVIRPGGGLLVGFFEGPAVEPFDHAVTTAYRWSVDELGKELAAAGFELIEAHTRRASGHRPHGAITARRRAV